MLFFYGGQLASVRTVTTQADFDHCQRIYRGAPKRRVRWFK